MKLFITQIASAKYSAAASLVPEFFEFSTAYCQFDKLFCPDPLRLPILLVVLGLVLDPSAREPVAGIIPIKPDGCASAVVAAISRVAICKILIAAELPALLLLASFCSPQATVTLGLVFSANTGF